LIELAHELKKRGATKVIACLSHLLLSREGVRRIEESPVDLLIATDSVTNDNIADSKKIRKVSVAPLFAQALIRIHNKESVSPLFTNISENIMKQSYHE